MVAVPPDVVCSLCNVWVGVGPLFNRGFVLLLSVYDCRFDIYDVRYLCKKLVGQYGDIEVIPTTIVVVGSTREGVCSVFCSRVMFYQDVIVG